MKNYIESLILLINNWNYLKPGTKNVRDMPIMLKKNEAPTMGFVSNTRFAPLNISVFGYLEREIVCASIRGIKFMFDTALTVLINKIILSVYIIYIL